MNRRCHIIKFIVFFHRQTDENERIVSFRRIGNNPQLLFRRF